MELKIGTQLTLEPTYTERNETFRCRIIEKTDQILFIDYPINLATNKTAFLVDGAQFRVTFNSDTKVSYSFHTEVLGRKGGLIPTIMLKCPVKEEIIKIQRREYVRVETPVDVAIEHDGVKRQLVAEDISAGGIAVRTRGIMNFNEGDNVKVLAVLPFVNGDIHYVDVEATVVRLFERDEIQLASLCFNNPADVDQQHIVRFCFERQVMMRKKEFNV